MKRSRPSDLVDERTCSTFDLANPQKRARSNALHVSSQAQLSHTLMENACDDRDTTGENAASHTDAQVGQRLEASQNRIRAASAPPNDTTGIEAEAPTTSRTIAGIAKRAAELSKKQKEHMAAAERLQQRVAHGQKALGEQLRESLRIQSAIQTQREQNRVDKQDLDDARARSRAVADELDWLLQEMQLLSQPK